MSPAPLASMPDAVRRSIRGVLTDIDDTLTSAGILGPPARAALDRLFDAGIPVVAITGRPAGLCEQLLEQWPLAAIVGENGGVWIRRDPATRAIAAHYEHDADERARQRAALSQIADRILAQVPGAARAVDLHRRETDVAIDWSENVAPLPRADVDRIVALLRAEGLSTAVSSIHIHGWYGEHDKLATTLRLFAAAFGVDLGAERAYYTYIGDAPNDVGMLQYAGVAVAMDNAHAMVKKIADWIAPSNDDHGVHAALVRYGLCEI